MSSMPATQANADGHGSLSIQVVHTAGITRCLYAPKAAKLDRLFTAGDDFLVRLLPQSSTSDTPAQLIEDATGPITWIDAGKDHLVVASEDGTVRLYRHHPGTSPSSAAYESQLASPTDLAAVLTRNSLPARCAALEKSVGAGKAPRAAICGDELIVKLVDVEDTRRVNLLTGHARAVRSASWSPTAPTLITSSCDGTARIWDCSTSEPGSTKVLEHLPITRPEDETDVHAEWHPSGQSFVLLSKGNELIIHSASQEQGWVRSGVFAASARGTSAIPPPTGPTTALAFCPNGRYLAAATTDGQVTIWETSSRMPVRARKADSNVTSISWNPDADALAWVDTTGQLARWEDVLGSSYASPCEPVAFAAQQSSVRARSAVDDLFDGTGLVDEAEDNDAAGRFMDDEADDGGRRRDRDEEDGEGDEDGLDGFLVDDEGGEYSRALDKERRQRKVTKPSRPGTTIAASRSQPTFQPNSTPMRNSRRFLSLSLFGSLVSIDQETHSVVSFESFDTAARRNWKMVDHFGYSMASVATCGALLACPQKGDSKSAVHFKPFEAAGAWSVPGAEWGVEMPLGEEVVAVAMGGAPAQRGGDEDAEQDAAIAKSAAALTSTAIVATSTGYLRFFSSSGLQRYVWAMGGNPIVALAAGKQHAIVVHRSHSTALDGFQDLSYTVIDLITFQTRQTGTLPLGRDVTLQWIGFNELDVPVLYDSRGVLYLLDRSFAAIGQARWTPVLDTNALSAQRDAGSSTRTTFWPLAASSTQLFCIFVRGATSFPDPSAPGHPLIQEVDYKLPLLSLEEPAGELEEKHLRQSLLASSIRSAFASLLVPPTEYAADVPDPAALVHQADKDALQLIQLACKGDKHARALDAARTLHGSRMLEAALQICSFFHLPSLADRMSSLRGWVESSAEREERMELDAAEAVRTEDFAEAAERGRRSGGGRVLVASSQDSGRGATSATTSHARRALMEEFRSTAADAGTPRRSQRAGANFDALSSSTACEAAAMPPPASSRALADSTHLNGDATRKRKGDDDLDGSHSGGEDDSDVFVGEADSRPPPQKQRSTSNPFSKPSLTNGTARPGNPFARQPGMTRDRSMHKSSSFFDRAEAHLSGTGAAAEAASGSSSKKGKTKQSTLFGMAGANGSGRSKPSSTASSVPAPTPAWGETQQSEDGGDEEMEESLRLTLDSAAEKEANRQKRGGLEETQMQGDDDEEESQVEGAGEAEAEDEQEQSSSRDSE
ncbi:hypothetical protein BDZ90DRAFT_251484 [Jaminaea rosea]|uniref:Uncharacterized protein n=1 Tax=Jaminaea rosea TaxID=1569628 RepID=A0A316URM3_9BASI|nr:hypothetical protein BDZ90DRAFT_251484 [Jaminaea rosea]PWN27942.1 hypothetical protein BDZ90DRAFT_251484 [Jaminaea rosea]